MDGPYLMIENVTVFDTNLNGMLEPAENAEIGIRLGQHWYRQCHQCFCNTYFL
jgi:hypothetical protein